LLKKIADTRATAAYRLPVRDKLIIGTADGRVLFAEAKFHVTYPDATSRTVKPLFNELGVITISPDATEVARVHGRQSGSGTFHFAAALADGRVFTGTFTEDEPLEEAQAGANNLVRTLTTAIGLRNLDA
ncbi:MAG: hypothetical protein HC793_01825, partial [Aquincola sp.]|nr:hypothetical protein [Aquincola sp.]